MAQLTLWTLPLNLPNPYPYYLQFLTSERDGRLYYSKYIVDVIGELTVGTHTNNVREWEIPHAFYSAPYGNPIGITRGPKKTVWFLLESGQRLVELDPGNGQFTAYGEGEFPFHYPRHLAFDRYGSLWYTGAGRIGGLVGRLDRARRSVTFWELPRQLLRPEGIWVESTGRSVWFTPVYGDPCEPGALLGRLIPATNTLTIWTYPPTWRVSRSAGVAGNLFGKSGNIWFTYDGSGPASRVFRLHYPSGTIFEYAPKFAAPRSIVLDTKGNAWIGHWIEKVSLIKKNADCGTISLPSYTLQVTPSRMRVKPRTKAVTPMVHSVIPEERQILFNTENCYRDYILPRDVHSHGIALTSRQELLPPVYFTSGGHQLGRLTP